MGDSMEKVIEPAGAFVASLKRNNQKIRDDRATNISKKALLTYRRAVEDLQTRLDELKDAQDGLLDLSPTDANSLILATDFNADKYVDKDIALSIEIRNTEIKLEVAKKRYDHLFGG